jgi:hypothetical protein
VADLTDRVTPGVARGVQSTPDHEQRHAGSQG